MSFGIYIHIPYCLQLCSYCDFAKYEVGAIPDQDHYTELLLKEIRQKKSFVPQQTVTSIYFGGGTPSLMAPYNFAKILGELKNSFHLKSGLEITIEINPGTLLPDQISKLVELGISRFSVGVQTFQDSVLKNLGRKHSAQDTRETLAVLANKKMNVSMDLLFALPGQTLQDTKNDLNEMLAYHPSHISTYYLNVPHQHFLSQNRPPDDTQVEMFHFIEDFLSSQNILRYEISNFAVPGKESQHNIIYWTQNPYLGFGLSAHSYYPETGPWGTRFSNPRTYGSYEKHVLSLKNYSHFLNEIPPPYLENLEKHQAMTEFCYTALRYTQKGLSRNDFLKKFQDLPHVMEQELVRLQERGLLEEKDDRFYLTKEGRILSNLVFERLTFLKEDLY